MNRTFPVWAPAASTVRVVIEGGGEPRREHDLAPTGGGWWQLPSPLATSREVLDYGFVVDGDGPHPDPRSRWQPRGVQGLSREFDPNAHSWHDNDWGGRAITGAVIYELHLGTFTPEGTLDSAIERLDHLAELGVDAVELLPVNAFDGSHGWGYDGVLWFAVHEPYGGPICLPALRRCLSRAGPRRHSGCRLQPPRPERQHIADLRPVPFRCLRPVGCRRSTSMAPTPTRCAGTSSTTPSSGSGTCMSTRLRLDAVHALHDSRALTLLEELAAEVDELAARVGRPLGLIAESDLNDPKLIRARRDHGTGLTAQWNDDVHHALHANLTGETSGYYADFAGLGSLVKVFERGFFHDGTWSSFRERHHGRPLDPGTSFARLIAFSQDHDQIGNRATGDRLPASLGDGALAAAAAITLLGPFTPMLFMGEEWGASTPWQFFTSHPDPAIGEATTRGRIAEFSRMGWDAASVPDPQDPATFARSHLDWSEVGRPPHTSLLAFYRHAIALRREIDRDEPAVDVAADEATGLFSFRRGALQVVAALRDGTHEVAPGGTDLILSSGGVMLERGILRFDGPGIAVMR